MIGTIQIHSTQRSSCCIKILFLITTSWLIPKSVSSSSIQQIHHLEEEVGMMEPEAQDRKLIDPRIIGGSNAGANLYKWFAMPIRKNGVEWGCGGALVAPEFVLSAVCISMYIPFITLCGTFKYMIFFVHKPHFQLLLHYTTLYATK